jgi:hypothetical protein
MPRVYLLAPLVASVAFFLYYAHWTSTVEPQRFAQRSVDRYSDRDGAREARATIAHGKLMLLTSGLAMGDQTARNEIARTKFGIEYHVIAGCDVTPGLVEFSRAYNRVMTAEIISRFGSDVFDRLNREADDLLDARRVIQRAKR